MDKRTWFIGGVFVLGLAFVGWQAVRPVPADKDQGHSMAQPDTGKLEAGASLVSVKLPAQLSSNAAIGKTIYEAKCIACHGANAAGQNGTAPPLVHKIYEPGHHSDISFVLAVERGVRSHHWRFGDMPPIDGLTQADVKMVTTYVRELQRENGIN